MDGNNSPVSAIAPGALVAPIVPANAPYLGGLPGLIATVTGIDPQNPNRFAPPPLDDGLQGFYRDDPAQPWLLWGRR